MRIMTRSSRHALKSPFCNSVCERLYCVKKEDQTLWTPPSHFNSHSIMRCCSTVVWGRAADGVYIQRLRVLWHKSEIDIHSNSHADKRCSSERKGTSGGTLRRTPTVSSSSPPFHLQVSIRFLYSATSSNKLKLLMLAGIYWYIWSIYRISNISKMRIPDTVNYVDISKTRLLARYLELCWRISKLTPWRPEVLFSLSAAY